MKGIKIDVEKQEVYEVEIDDNNSLKAMYETIGCELVDRRVIGLTTDVWFDDEGLLHEELAAAFTFPAWPHAIHGNGLILDFNDEGESVTTTCPIDLVRNRVIFLN